MNFNMPVTTAGLLATQLFWVCVMPIQCKLPNPYNGDADAIAIDNIFTYLESSTKLLDDVLEIEGNNKNGKNCFDVACNAGSDEGSIIVACNDGVGKLPSTTGTSSSLMLLTVHSRKCESHYWSSSQDCQAH